MLLKDAKIRPIYQLLFFYSQTGYLIWNLIRSFDKKSNNLNNMSKILSVFTITCILVLLSCSKDEETKADCSGVSPTYTSDIAPIINLSCAISGCHTAIFPADGLDLSTYSKVKSASINGKVLQSIKHLSGVKAMPQDAAKLSVDKITKVECWIQAGAPE